MILINKKWERYVLTPFAVLSMSGFMSFTMMWIMKGFFDGFIETWLHNWATAFLVALPSAFIIPKYAIKLAVKVFKIKFVDDKN
ncbi:DUF2798 domain-containing protein [Rodentibacter haemolyticus]|nr:DUF2798 domain-containing protein [Rodentibacter haemolyticus]